MNNVTKLHVVLILVFVFFISGLVIELLYLLRCRSLRRQACGHCTVADPELLGDSSAEDGFAYSKWTLFCTLCFNIQSSSRVESAYVNPSPAVKAAAIAVAALAEQQTVEASVDDEEEDSDLTRWREKCLGHSRVLYTIDEEDEEEEDDVTAVCEEEEVHHGDDVDGGVTPFYTPASSPPHLSDEGRDPVAGDMPLAWEWR